MLLEGFLNPLLNAVSQCSIQHFAALERPDNFIVLSALDRPDARLLQTSFFLVLLAGVNACLLILFLSFSQL
jgi:hypothetical protein